MAVRRRDEMHRLSRVRDDGGAPGVDEPECAVGAARKVAAPDDSRFGLDRIRRCSQLCVAALHGHAARRRLRSRRARLLALECLCAVLAVVSHRSARENLGNFFEWRDRRRHRRHADSGSDRIGQRRRSTNRRADVTYRFVSGSCCAGSGTSRGSRAIIRS